MKLELTLEDRPLLGLAIVDLISAGGGEITGPGGRHGCSIFSTG
jgi:hypothetical protein